MSRPRRVYALTNAEPPPNAMAYATGAVSVREMRRTGGLISAIAIVLLLLGYQLMLPFLFRT